MAVKVCERYNSWTTKGIGIGSKTYTEFPPIVWPEAALKFCLKLASRWNSLMMMMMMMGHEVFKVMDSKVKVRDNIPNTVKSGEDPVKNSSTVPPPLLSSCVRKSLLLFNTFSFKRTWTHVRYMSSSVRLSVTFVRPTLAIEILVNMSTPFGTLAICWHPGKILRRSSQGNPSVGGVKHKRGSWI